MAAIVLVAAALGSGHACAPAEPSGPSPETIAAGRQLYDRNGCANCHGADGSGRGPNAAYMDPPPRDYRDPGSYRGGTDVESIAASIATGFIGAGGGMPAFSHLTLEQRLQIGAFVASFQQPEAAHVEIQNAWVAEMPPGTAVAAAYMRLVAQEADAVVAAEARGVGSAEIHRTGEAGMERLERLELEAGDEVELRPAGVHLMLMEVDEPLAAGDEVEITLFLESRTAKRIRVPVRRRDDGR